jgi:hypothetical protein
MAAANPEATLNIQKYQGRNVGDDKPLVDLQRLKNTVLAVGLPSGQEMGGRLGAARHLEGDDVPSH